MEHFGITTVEAMAGGAVPLVFAAGGYKEIVEDGVNGWLWDSKGDLKFKTKKLIENSKSLREMSAAAKSSAQRFEYERFDKEVLALL